jgi:hypothetical protein
MIAARQIAFGKAAGKGLSAKDYVQDGLVAHLDGIESLDYGVRSDDHMWTCLKSGDSAAMGTGDLPEGVYGWTEYGWLGSGLGYITIPNLADVFANGMTIECLSRQYNDHNEDNLCGFNASGMFLFTTQLDYTRVFYVWSSVRIVDPRIAIGNRDAMLFTAVIKPSGTMDCYINGELVCSDATAGSAPTSNLIYIGRSYRSYACQRELMNYRVYDKPLSGSDIQANYNIDKARFGL